MHLALAASHAAVAFPEPQCCIASFRSAKLLYRERNLVTIPFPGKGGETIAKEALWNSERRAPGNSSIPDPSISAPNAGKPSSFPSGRSIWTAFAFGTCGHARRADTSSRRWSRSPSRDARSAAGARMSEEPSACDGSSVFWLTLVRFADAQPTRMCSLALGAEAGSAVPAGRRVAGNCRTVARWPSHKRVSRTTCPSGNSSASW